MKVNMMDEVAWECSTCGYYENGLCRFYHTKCEPDDGRDCDYWWEGMKNDTH